MLFNTLHFLFFFVIVTLSYYSLGWKGRWRLLLLASCYFYMVFRPVYILILFATIIIDYFAGIWIERSTGGNRKKLLIVSLISNIGILAVFKYYNFFNENLTGFLGAFHLDNPIPFLNILLPIGLSFHTFQAMSYTIEVYRGNQPAERHFGIYALYVMFYPQLVAGPIERPQNILAQMHAFHRLDWKNVREGLMLMAWGMFKKVVIAERLGMLVDYAYMNPGEKNGLTLLTATFFYCFQIYCDFSGYSDIAIGSAKVMGFDLMENFRAPYFSRSISEFWRRWHISLSTWFRDYLYIPLGGSRTTVARNSLNLLIVFTISGLWHGARWNFVIWGALHGLFLVLAMLKNRFLGKKPEGGNALADTVGTFLLVMFSWIFFRATSFQDAVQVLKGIAGIHLSDSIAGPMNPTELLFSFFLIGLLMLKDRFAFHISTQNTGRFVCVFAVLVVCCYFLGVFNSNQFIYFQF